MNEPTLRLLRALVEPARSVELGLAGHEGVASKLAMLKAEGFIVGKPSSGKGHLYSLTLSGLRLIGQGGSVTPPPTFVPQGLYVPPAWQVMRPGAGDAAGLGSAGWPT